MKMNPHARMLMICTGCLIVSCADPLSNDDGHVIRTLLEGTTPQGSYVIFWDGMDENDAYAPPGTYYAHLYASEFDFVVELNAIAGGEYGTNDNSVYNEGDLSATINILEDNFPDPFRIRDGTNLPIQLRETRAVRLTIRDNRP